MSGPVRRIPATLVFVPLLLLVPAVNAAPAETQPVTFHRDVEPILQSHCQNCHRAGEIGPMPLITFADARKWAAAIKQAVVLKRMPPWYAESAPGHFSNDTSLSPGQTETIRNWVNNGSPEGSPADAPPARNFVTGWGIGTPDLEIAMPEYQIPATGAVEYTYVILPSHLTKDTWVRSSEIRPGNRAAVHHAFLFVRTPGSRWFAGYPTGAAFVPGPRPGSTKQRNSDGDRTAEGSRADEQIASYVPGEEPVRLPDDTAVLVKAGSDFVLQIHYVTSGKPASDATRIGLVFAPRPPAHRAFFDGVSGSRFTIPPGDPGYAYTASVTLATDVRLLSSGPHMHLRGKSMELRAIYPNGASETLFNVPHYDFRWQQLYEYAEPKLLPRGTRLEAHAVFDNSANNRDNPDPTATVRFGEQTWEEMMIGFLTLQIDPASDIDQIMQHAAARPVTAGR